MNEGQVATLMDKITAALERDPRVDMHAAPVTVRARNNKIYLEGRVQDIAAKRAAVNAAWHVTQGQWPLRDWIHVAAEPTEDLALRNELEHLLSREPAFEGYDLYAEVGERVDTVRDAEPDRGIIIARAHKGAVILEGRVESLTHRRLAEVLAWWAAGSEYVDNRLQVAPPEEDNDNEITDAVRIILEKDPMVHADQLRVGTAGGVVEIKGSVASTEEKRLAVLDAWYVPGVWDVIDEIELHEPRS